MSSEGIELNPPEPQPLDPYIQSRNQPLHVYKSPSTYDNLKQFIEMDRKVLRFYCVWDDRDSMFGEIKPYVSTCICIYTITHIYMHIIYTYIHSY